jgi:hypothetical protein
LRLRDSRAKRYNCRGDFANDLCKLHLSHVTRLELPKIRWIEG